MTEEAGVRVVLTDQARMPFPFDEGFSVSTGFSTSVGIKKVMTKTKGKKSRPWFVGVGDGGLAKERGRSEFVWGVWGHPSLENCDI